MSGHAKPGGAPLLANVPEAETMEQMEILEGSIRRLPSRLLLVTQRRTRLVGSVCLHLVGFLVNLAVILAFCLLDQFKFFPALVFLMMLNAGLSTWVAMKDPDITCLANWGYGRLPFLFLVYGVFQYIQIKHLFDVYRRRLGEMPQDEGRIVFHAKTYNGLFEGVSFSWVSLWSYFLLDKSLENCPWYFHENVQSSAHPWGFHTVHFNVIFMVAAVISTSTVATGVMDIDYRVSETVRDAIDSSINGVFLQWCYRVFEAGSRISLIVLMCIVFKPVTITWMNDRFGGDLLLPLFPAGWFVVYFLIIRSSRAQGAQRDHFAAYAVMAGIMWFVNPFRFVDNPAHITAARHINLRLWMARVVEIFMVVVMLLLSRKSVFPDHLRPGFVTCYEDENGDKVSVKVLQHILKEQPELLGLVAFNFLAFSCVCALPLFRSSNFSHNKKSVLTDESVLDMIPSDGGEAAAVAVRKKPARGICSHVLRVGFGITSQIFAKEEQAFGNFTIEKVLGRGAYGVVVLVRMRNKRSAGSDGLEASNGANDVMYAMKMQNTDGRKQRDMASGILPSRATTAERECEIMRKLDHPFIVRLAYFFEVPDRPLKDASSGDIIVDSLHNHRFHKAIVMEFCPGGDLDAFIFKKAFPPLYRQEKRADQSTAQWIVLSRRLVAEMCVALNFLHERDIVYRDLKPQNMLLKSGPDHDVHICFTDFGFSKDVSGQMAADSLAGSPLYAAPEVMAIAAKQERVQYTPAVDLFSLGRVVCVMMWRTKLMEDSSELKMPSLDDCKEDPRVHKDAWLLMAQLTSPSPARRGKASELERLSFFQEIILETGQVMPALKWAGLENYAS